MNKIEKKLMAIFTDLDKDDQNSLTAFAEFLLDKAKKEGRYQLEEQIIVKISRPKEEKVVAAIKRLSATYPMLPKDSLMNQTASLMSEHILKGRAAVEVINEQYTMSAPIIWYDAKSKRFYSRGRDIKIKRMPISHSSADTSIKE